jgi:hypothetical protein
MKFFDFQLIAYFLFLKKYKEKGLEASILILTVLFTLFLVALFFYLSHFIINNPVILNPISIGSLFLILSIFINRLLKNKYLRKYEYIAGLTDKLNNKIFIILLMIFAILFFIFSIFIFVCSFRFLP